MDSALDKLFNEFMYECEFVQMMQPKTLRGYRHTFGTFRKLAPHITLGELSPATLNQFFKILNTRKRMIGKGKIVSGIKKSTASVYWTKLNKFFEWLRVRKHIRANPFSQMVYPTPSYEDRKFLSRHAIEKILSSIHNHSGNNLLLLKRNLVIFYILLFCGLRKEELVMLQIRDIDLDRRTLTVRGENSKVPRTRTLPLHSQTVMYLKDYLRERKRYTTQFLLVSRQRDDKLSYEGLSHLITKLRNTSGVKFHLHQFRHTFAVNFLKSSNNIAKLKQLLGHKDITMTLVYLRCLPTNEMRADIENMGIDSLI